MRWAFALGTGGVIAAGAIYGQRGNSGSLDAGFFALVAIALLPTVVYLAGVRSHRSRLLCGGLLLGVTCLGWASIVQDDAMRGVGAVAAFPATLVLAVIFTMVDRAERQGQNRRLSAPAGWYEVGGRDGQRLWWTGTEWLEASPPT
jgi:hypothetical protein